MGCFNETDCITQLPIFSGDEVYMFAFNEKDINLMICEQYSSLFCDVYQGHYNDYGFIEEIDIVDKKYIDENGYSRNNDCCFVFARKETVDEIKNLLSENSEMINRQIRMSRPFDKLRLRLMMDAKSNEVSDETVLKTNHDFLENYRIYLLVSNYARENRLSFFGSIDITSQDDSIDTSRAEMILKQAEKLLQQRTGEGYI